MSPFTAGCLWQMARQTEGLRQRQAVSCVAESEVGRGADESGLINEWRCEYRHPANRGPKYLLGLGAVKVRGRESEKVVHILGRRISGIFQAVEKCCLTGR